MNVYNENVTGAKGMNYLKTIFARLAAERIVNLLLTDCEEERMCMV